MNQGLELNTMNKNPLTVMNHLQFIAGITPTKLSADQIPCGLRVCFYIYKWMQYVLFIGTIVYLCIIRSFENFTNEISTNYGPSCLKNYYLITGVEYCFMMFGVANFFLMNHALKGIANVNPGFFAALKLIIEL